MRKVLLQPWHIYKPITSTMNSELLQHLMPSQMRHGVSKCCYLVGMKPHSHSETSTIGYTHDGRSTDSPLQLTLTQILIALTFPYKY